MKNRISFWIPSFLLFIVFLISVNNCRKEKGQLKLPVVTTSEVTGVTSNRAYCGGTISSDVPVPVTECGVCWSTAQTPTIADFKSVSDSGVVSLGSFTCEIKNLKSSTTYSIAAYATNGAGTAYGKVLYFTSSPTLIDIDGNVYSTVTIGTQTWMAENLKTSRYRNGDPIPNVTDLSGWSNLSTGAYSVYNNDEEIGAIYGKLYNYFAVQDERKIAPEGWHVATNNEWRTLINFLGGQGVSPQKMKQTGNIFWGDVNECGLYDPATNSSGFTALGAGYRINDGRSDLLRIITYFWGSSKVYPNFAFSLFINCANWSDTLYMDKTWGFSVRCLKDNNP